MTTDPVNVRPQPTSESVIRQAATQTGALPAAQRRSGAAAETDAPRAPGGDTVELSDAARALGRSAGAEPVPEGTLSAERLQSVLARLSSGHYDGPEARGVVASRVAPDLDD